MTGFQLPDKLRQHRPLLLALEAIGWLHMTGKAKVDLLLWHGGQKDNYDYKAWHELETPPFPWDDLLKWVRDNYSDNLEDKVVWPQTLTEFITKHADGKSQGNLVGLLQAGHAMASGIEKNLPKDTSKYLGQDATHMWLSTAFGQPARNLLADPPELLTETGWKRLLVQIEGLLTELKKLGSGTSSETGIEDWWRWRENAVGRGKWLCKAFSSTLAETRLPNNDVTLFDQSYVAAALFKSAAAGAILEGKSFPWTNNSLKQQTRWRLLTIGIGVDHFEARSVKIGDWTGARLALDEFFFKVRRFVEVDLAVGSLLYADGEVHAFSFPGERFDHQSQGSDLQIADWEKCLAQKIDGYARKANLETPPYCRISEPSRALVGMTAEIRKARETMAVPLHCDWAISGEDLSGGHVCPVCLVRGNGDNSSKQTPCKVCKDRRTGRLDKWLSGEIETDSIWISELADANDRVALVTMSLDIEPWLDGTRLDSLRTQAIPEWNEHSRLKQSPIRSDKPYESMLSHTQKKLNAKNFPRTDNVFTKLHAGFGKANNWEEFFFDIVEDRADAPKWDALDNDERAAKWLTHQLFRKLASPGRIYRFQRQAKDFFKSLLTEFRVLVAADRNRWRTRRLVIKRGNGSSGPWEDRQVYNGRHSDAPVSLLYREQSKDFLTICNLSRLLKPEQGKDSLSGFTVELKAEDREYKKKTEKLKVRLVSDEVGELGCYHPVIPLDLSPVRFRVLVPLETASACVDRAVRAWNDQFARVWDRLPLQVGVVAFPRKSPFQAVIEAIRNIEADLTANRDTPETRRIDHSETREGVVALSLVCPDGQNALRTVQVKLPDGREDVFYPYLAVEDRQVRFPHDFQHPNGQTYRHAKDLRSGDSIFVYPPLVATIFMDDTARRFEAVEGRKHRLMEWKRMRDLWKLIKDIAPSQTALRGAWSEVVERREAWQGPNRTRIEGGQEAWLDLVRAVFHKRLRARGACLETLVEAARDGLLDWSLEWHMSVLKKQVSGGDR
ncbi:MAG: CRISPR-associated protein Csx11 [Deltaproteobacteria bacterium]|nr:CRISPR-associated protein Csx11 [Deltaproteobacteria bacterium]